MIPLCFLVHAKNQKLNPRLVTSIRFDIPMNTATIAKTSNLIFRILLVSASALSLNKAACAADEKPQGSGSAAKISFHKQIKPIFQANCQGCHQPAKAQGGYVMTDFTRLMQPGDSKEKPIIAGKPDDSYLIDQITVHDGKAEMPKDKSPLAASDTDLVRQWVAQGAVDDSPAGGVARFDRKNPPVYSIPAALGRPDAVHRRHLL
ncbi:MAG: c-type cytochrome domain-containing protein [bacterium]